jgi:hypothetical protein
LVEGDEGGDGGGGALDGGVVFSTTTQPPCSLLKIRLHNAASMQPTTDKTHLDVGVVDHDIAEDLRRVQRLVPGAESARMLTHEVVHYTIGENRKKVAVQLKKI